MKTINLINKNSTEVNYELTCFPDGEPHIKFEDIGRKDNYKVICRIASPNDLFIVMQVGNILNRQGVEYDLYITYLMSMRMDRVINFNEAFSLEIVANVINSLNARKVYIFEPHSDRSLSLIHNSEPMDLSSNYHMEVSKIIGYYDQVCFPDHGAYERYKETLPYQNKPLIMEKKRDLNNNGKIVSMNMKNPEDLMFAKIVIVDDLCDAGGTFCWAADVIREEYKKEWNNVAKIDIFVKHLVNSVGLQNLAKTFDNVYITDSYKDWFFDIKTQGLNNVHIIKLFE